MVSSWEKNCENKNIIRTFKNRGEEWVTDKHDSSKNYCASDIEKVSMPDDQNKDYYELNQNKK